MDNSLPILLRSPKRKGAKRSRSTAKKEFVATANALETPADGAERTGADPLQVDISKVAEYLRRTGLFDAAYYLATYPDIAASSIDPFEHFFQFGFAEGRRPNPIFDPLWYLNSFPDVKELGMQPLLHYAQFGENEGRRPAPLFDPTWYRTKYNLPQSVSALGHYLKHRIGPYSPIPEFDATYYLETYKDIAAANVDPFEHFISYGYREGRNPSPDFDTKFYSRRYLQGKLDVNPLVHYLEHRHLPGILPRPSEHEATIPATVKRFTRPGPQFEEWRPLAASTTAPRRAKLLAFYLTQFHPFPENDRWWGAGFTEWTNISRGMPRFRDHYQPRIPRDLGFYSLDRPETMEKQIAIAKAAGIYGFAFYYYWFNQRRLMEKPLEQFLRTPNMEMPFCLMWANENWTRRWDGMESEVLISQDYRPDDDEELLADFVRHFEDPRYIRLQSRPLLMIYRPSLIPEARDVISRWRLIFRERFNQDPIIVMCQSFNNNDPTAFGLDGALEFPPHKVTSVISQVSDDIEYFDDTFSGQIYRYEDVVKYSLDEPSPSFPLIKTVVPSWDNDARRQGTGLVVHGSTPAKYERWLSALIERARQEPFFNEPIVCINAWNEWCEGAYLEPDLYFGSAYLNATARAVAGVSRDPMRPRLLLVGHDAFPSGAQHLLLNIGRTLRVAFGIEIEYLLLAGGKLEEKYEAVAPVTVLKDATSLAVKIRGLRERGISAAIVNTSAAGEAAALLGTHGIRTILLIHELPRLIEEKGLAREARMGMAGASEVVFASNFVRDRVLKALGIASTEHHHIRPQGNYTQIVTEPEEGELLRQRFGIPPHGKLVLGVGYADMRKGFDLFLQAWRVLLATGTQAHFCWLGDMDPDFERWLGAEIASAKATGTFHLVGFQADVGPYFSAADAFALTSREDPFPTVALEALSVGVPVVAFDHTGGIPEFLRQKNLGYVVPYCDVPSMIVQLRKLFDDGWDETTRAQARATIANDFSFARYARDLLRLALPELSSVSVAVPNYNYAHCLTSRLDTIFDQTHPTEEIIVLDDASTDDSVNVIERAAESRDRDISLVINETNSGSVFAQWRTAAEMAIGDFIWIAEADDLSEPSFLSSMLALMRDDPKIALGFSDSRSIDADGATVFASYKPYFATVATDALTQTEVFDGADFLRRFLSVKNLILNVSSVVWRREPLLRALDACQDDLANFHMAGDWRIYLECLTAPGAKIAYVASTLNIHRRHAASITHSLKAQKHVDEIARMQQAIRQRLRLPSALMDQQQAYLDEVAQQLDSKPLNSSAPATIRKERPKRRSAKSKSSD